MDFTEIVDISQGSLEIMNPTTPEKVVSAGYAAGLKSGLNVVEFGCGNGTVLKIWAEKFGIRGTGIDVREDACANARRRIKDSDLAGSIEILCADASVYVSDEPFDCAACIGAAQIWGGFESALHSMKEYVKEEGSLIIGERYWKSDRVAPEFSREWSEICTEYELLGIARDEGFDPVCVVRAGDDDWAAYESGIWQGCIRWLRANPDHPYYDEVAEYLHTIQDEYFAYGREYMGWAMYVLTPSVI